MRELIKDDRHRIRRDHRYAANKCSNAHDQRPKTDIEEGRQHHPYRHHKLDPQPCTEHVYRASTSHKAAIYDGHDEQENDIQRKVITKMLRQNVVNLDIDKWSRAQELEHSCEAESARQHIAQHTLMTKQRGEVTDRGTNVKLLPTFNRQGFINKEEDHR